MLYIMYMWYRAAPFQTMIAIVDGGNKCGRPLYIAVVRNVSKKYYQVFRLALVNPFSLPIY